MQTLGAGSHERLPPLERAAGVGAWLGFAGSLWGSTAFWGLAWAVTWLVDLLDGRRRTQPYELADGNALTFGCFTVLFTALPCMLAGALVGSLLLERHERGSTRPGRGVLLGAGIGFATGGLLLLALGVSLGYGGPLHVRLQRYLADSYLEILVMGVLSAIVGAWHGWCMSRWLARRAASRQASDLAVQVRK